MVSTAVARSAKITKVAPMTPANEGDAANATQNAAATQNSGEAGRGFPYEIVLILAMVIVLVSAWHLTKYHYHH
jgi:hypothetical protein